MARGDVHLFTSFELKSKSGVSFNLTSDTLKIGIVNNTIVPTTGTADPRWGSAGSTDLSANQVATTGTSYTGPQTLSSVTYASNTPTGVVATTNTTTGTANSITVTAISTGYLTIGQPISGAGIPAYSIISAFGTGTGGTGTYIISQNATAAASGVTITAGMTIKLSFGNVTMATDASGFTTGYYAIIYDSTVSGNYALGFIDLGGPVSLVGGSLSITLNSTNGFGTEAPV